jgi:hypothetical protein
MFEWSARQYNKATVRLTREGDYHTFDIGGILDRTRYQLNRK